MKFSRRFGSRKRSRPRRGLFLVVLLIIVVYLWMNMEDIITRWF